MGNKTRSTVLVAAAVALMLSAGLAYACTAQTRILSITPQAGAWGTMATVRADSLAPNTPVQVRWNSVEGPELATAVADKSGSLAATFSLPRVSPGIYYVVVSSEGLGVGRIAFEITASPASSGKASGTARSAASRTSDLWSGFASSEAASSVDVPQSGPAGGFTPGALAGMSLVAAGAMAITGMTIVLNRRRKHIRA